VTMQYLILIFRVSMERASVIYCISR